MAAAAQAPRFQEVMLADKWKADVDIANFYASEKKDGIRSVWTGAKMYSRQGNVFDKIPAWFTASFPNIMLDGELCCGRNQFQKSLSIVKQQHHSTPEDFKLLKYHLFDAPTLPGGFEERIAELKRIVAAMNCPHVEVLEQTPCTDTADMLQRLDAVLAQGGEGLMLRKPGSMYEFGVRSKTLLKVKKFESTEARVTGWKAGKGNLSSMYGGVHCEMADGTTFDCGSGFNDALRRRPPPIGSIIEFKFQGKTVSNRPRFPIFLRVRADLTWANVLAAAGVVALPACPYGARCYRTRNAAHMAAMTH